MTDFKEELKKVPERPGVYLMHDEADRIIYVGKAVVLRNRLRSYFSNTPHNERITRMIEKIARFEFIVTDSEYEALLLECNLIKKHKPKYNVLLKDDKNYPYIKVTTGEEFPRVFSVRKKQNDGSTYFGPYYLNYTVKSTLDTLAKTFPMRLCRRNINPGKPQRVCLNYHIGLCPGPCAGYIDAAEYRKNVQAVCDFLSGKSDELIAEMREKMLEASGNTDFESAAEYRDRIKALETVSEKQKIMFGNKETLDVLAVAGNETDAVVQVFHAVEGQIAGRDYYVLEGAGSTEFPELYLSFIPQYYDAAGAVPSRILTADEIPEADAALVAEMLSELAGRKVTISNPKRGDKRQLCEMARENAGITLENYELTKRNEHGGNLRVLEKLRDVCGLDSLPLRVEAFDISNLGDSEIDGSMVVFANGKPLKSDYRHFKIKTLESRSDVGAMREMLSRRYTRLVNGDSGFDRQPDLILMDGSLAQIGEALEILDGLGLDIPVFGMVKDDRHRSRGLMSPEGREFRLEDDTDIWRFVTDVQNETHRFAIEYNRKLTEKRYKKSPLDDIKGIGDKRKVALLRRFGSVKGIREASVDDIAGVSGIGTALAEEIKNSLVEAENRRKGGK
ncbi:MAG: excinuclease ABC subunit UvrC [Clostridia bacterium]|nr:excinuclease ABC subunit UvrC [Clostridia bacterium]